MTISNSKKNVSHSRGFALLIAVVVSSIILAIGLSIMTITLKQLQFSITSRDSEVAFYAADAGMECALYWDYSSNGGKFDFGGGSKNISCMGSSITTNPVTSGSIQTINFQVGWGASPAVCADVTVKKYFDPSTSVTIDASTGDMCPRGVTCTRTVSKGYNVNCAIVAAPTLRTVERSLRASF